MNVRVPAEVERRVRRRWSRRARLIGYAGIAAYFGAAALLLWAGRGHLLFIWIGGFLAAIRYLRVGRRLEDNSSPIDRDAETQKLLGKYEENIRVEGHREIAQGSLSMPAPSSEGELSLAPEAGSLSHPRED